MDDEFFLPNQNELDFEFQDLTFKSTIKKLLSENKSKELIASVVRYTEDMIKLFIHHNISVRDQ